MSEMTKHRTRQLTVTAFLTALIFVLQLFATGIKIGPFTITLSLIPIIIGAILYGPATGAFLGLVFGLIVTFVVISGAEAFSLLMFQANPVMTIVTCLLKGVAAGWFAGVFYRLFSKKNETVGAGAAAVIAPLMNTGIFCLAMLTIFRPLLEAAANGANAVTFLFTVFVGANFLAELCINVVLIPVVARIIKAAK